ncbi:tyrosine-type recombinase/integrase [Chelatococcus reniformis]|uniref:tyrosine-type recombinase/integrase n=1 Tax=Chelatococcus reniformis TaxID=1494448 RepID=UPI00166AF57C|nr:tyrosine-type recombinase/integrase [Chelatococcus reniformis]
MRLGPQHIRGGWLKYTQAKGEDLADREPVDVEVPVHPDLDEVIAGTKITHLTFLATQQGRARTPAGFGNVFREWCDAAGLPHCSAHGLRHAMAARLAERGASPHQIMSVTGHKTLAEVQRYTKAADRRGTAKAAMGLLTEPETGTEIVAPQVEVQKSATIRGKS